MALKTVPGKSVGNKYILREFSSAIIKIISLTDDVKQFILIPPTDFIFKAGQFVMVNIIRDGLTKPRAYSILNPPSEKNRLDLCIKIVPGGFASDFFSSLKENDQVTVRGPLGHFQFVEEEIEHWFIGVGTGIVPLYSMLKEYLPQSASKTKKFKLIVSARYQKDLLFFDELTSLTKKYPNFTYLPSLTREKWAGKTGRVQTHLGGDLENKQFYLCGLTAMVIEAGEVLLSKGVLKEKIKSEGYG